jgi:hypothetical protein
MLFASLLFGFAGTLTNILLQSETSRTKIQSNKFLKALFSISLLVGSLILLTEITGLNSMYASTIGFLVFTAVIWYQRRNLIKGSMLGLVTWLFLTAVGYSVILLIWPTFFVERWQWGNISGITILHIPIEEYLWFGSWGLVGSVLYEWTTGRSFVPQKTRKMGK